MWILGARHNRHQLVHLGLIGLAAEGADVERLDNLRRRFAGGDELGHHLPLLNLVMHRIAIEHVQRLRQRRLRLGLAGAHGVARGPAKGGQEVVASVAVGNLHGPRAEGNSRELVGGLGHLADAVQHHFGGDAADVSVGEVPFVAGVGFVPLRRPLVSLRVANVPHQAFEVVVVFHQLVAELFEQLGVAGRVADADVVHRLDDSLAEEVGPDAVGDAGGKVRVFRAGEPLA